MSFWMFSNAGWIFLVIWLHGGHSNVSQQSDFVILDSHQFLGLRDGEALSLQLSFKIVEGYHINANIVDDENLIPTELSFHTDNQIVVDSVIFPNPKLFRLQNTNTEMKVFDDELLVTIPIRSVEQNDIDSSVMKGKLHYQACDSFKCYFPRDVDFEISFRPKVE